MENTSERARGINFDEIKRIIKDDWHGSDSLDRICENLKEKNRHMSREEAVIRLMIELPKSG